jgi:predicted 3-demethylubiquinone-9 3-methyltransferase (glyoxalase superfamily)
MPKITPCLWFDDQAEEAVAFYTAIFRNSRVGRVTRYGTAGYQVHRRPAGTVMTVEFEIETLKRAYTG